MRQPSALRMTWSRYQSPSKKTCLLPSPRLTTVGHEQWARSGLICSDVDENLEMACCEISIFDRTLLM
ncbi:hypothetical protein EV132_104506 [Rhizobium sullae]|uniref:Uncharacterized protein n=1 Tax=Rhizobium sullae TaxID=50338 RepID=A0A4R3QD36_RHISU|nr:hypothetical protein EV132_104506 [Rhizobium sullae]